jgi:hypothetical protein
MAMNAPTHESLWLFADPVEPRAPVRRRSVDPHLQAARRLAQRIGSLTDHSPEQVQVGQEICRHLLAMLRAAAPDGRPGGDPSH